MPLVTTKSMFERAYKEHFSVGAFNVENMEMMQAVIAAAEAENAPVILQTTPSTLKYADTSVYSAMAKVMAENTFVPVAIHLDHGSNSELCEKAAKDGYTSLMIDGSKLPLEQNISLTKKVVDMAKTYSVCPSVEAELGKLGGKEDDVEVKDGEDSCTDPEEAIQFVEKTGVDSLAIAIGTAHGFYKGTPKLEFERLAQIRNNVDVPLVLHGASGIPDEDVIKAISLGICKVNFATELRVAYSDAVKAYIQRDSSVYDPKKYGASARDAVTALVRHRIKICMGK